ncbi:Thiamine-monophosphate kinase [BD1-7 clade bacterium]|uniref:Thiamine-monophosphate kinase n=1 Tax=BD1-7 clade bacterium TaxID=2029982 RepID=A0A5S9QGL1_9GAMM|nr:Thiamine-monophosphate kinase [BD1-7 clade bacterium]
MMAAAMGEFAIIEQYFARGARQLLKQHPQTYLHQGIGDDCAVVGSIAGHQVFSVDTSIAGRHFPVDADPADIGFRALNVAVSDLAAMGAEPLWFTLALALPDADEQWLQAFANGLFEAASDAPIMLLGGDTTRLPAGAPLTISVQVHGHVTQGTPLLRAGAQLGDTIYASGTLGDAGAGLSVATTGLLVPNEADRQKLLQAYLRPQPQLVLGQQLIGRASSCVDISDGLLADLQHILDASNVGATINLAALPLSGALTGVMPRHEAEQLALTAGDDYQLCFTSTLSPDELGLENVTAIGRITRDKGLCVLDAGGEQVQQDAFGFNHFDTH